ncbi:MAG: hypothetical protein K0R50_733 [Eubacterium sp.]|jgi:hypothetical protein|nr:hypothetical protein [Eubacterium sp.]
MTAKAGTLTLFFGILELMKNTIYHKNYGTGKRNVQLKIDEAFAEKVIPADDSVRLLDEIMEEMDHTALFRAYPVKIHNYGIHFSLTCCIMLLEAFFN